MILKTNPFLAIVNSYIIDVRCVSVYLDRYNSNQDCSHILTSVELGILESRMLNIASLFKGSVNWKLIKVTQSREVLSMVKTIMFEYRFQLFPKIGNQFISNGQITIHLDTNLLSKWRVNSANNTISISNETNCKPKDRYSPNFTTTGLPKGFNPQGNGVFVVPGLINISKYDHSNKWGKGRNTVYSISQTRRYSTDVRNHVFTKLESLSKLCNNNNNIVVDRKVYNFVNNPYFLEFAYNNMSPPETLDGVS